MRSKEGRQRFSVSLDRKRDSASSFWHRLAFVPRHRWLAQGLLSLLVAALLMPVWMPAFTLAYFFGLDPLLCSGNCVPLSPVDAVVSSVAGLIGVLLLGVPTVRGFILIGLYTWDKVRGEKK